MKYARKVRKISTFIQVTAAEKHIIFSAHAHLDPSEVIAAIERKALTPPVIDPEGATVSLRAVEERRQRNAEERKRKRKERILAGRLGEELPEDTGPGRKATVPGSLRTEQIRLAFDPLDYARIDGIASALELTNSDYLRMHLLGTSWTADLPHVSPERRALQITAAEAYARSQSA